MEGQNVKNLEHESFHIMQVNKGHLQIQHEGKLENERLARLREQERLKQVEEERKRKEQREVEMRAEQARIRKERQKVEMRAKEARIRKEQLAEEARLQRERAAEKARAERVANENRLKREKAAEEARLEARRIAEERKTRQRLKVEAEKKAKLERDRIQKQISEKLRRQREEVMLALAPLSVIYFPVLTNIFLFLNLQVDVSRMLFYMKFWRNHPKVVAKIHRKKIRRSLEKISTFVDDISQPDGIQLLNDNVSSHCLSKSVRSLHHYISRLSNNLNFFKVEDLLIRRGYENTLSLIKVAVVLPHNHYLNSSTQNWIDSRVSFGEARGDQFTKVCVIMVDSFDSLAGCDGALMIQYCFDNQNEIPIYDNEIQNYVMKNLRYCTLKISTSESNDETDEGMFCIRYGNQDSFDGILMNSIRFLCQSINHRRLEYNNLAAMLLNILRNFICDYKIRRIGPIVEQTLREIKDVSEKISSSYFDFPAIEFTTEDVVENYFINSYGDSNLSLFWKADLESAIKQLTSLFCVSHGSSDELFLSSVWSSAGRNVSEDVFKSYDFSSYI